MNGDAVENTLYFFGCLAMFCIAVACIEAWLDNKTRRRLEKALRREETE